MCLSFVLFFKCLCSSFFVLVWFKNEKWCLLPEIEYVKKIIFYCAVVSRSLSTDNLLVACRVLAQHVRVHYQQCQAHWGASVCCYLSAAGAAELGEPFCSGNRRCRRSRSDLWTSDAGRRTMATTYHNTLLIMPLSTGMTAHRQEARANVSLISGPLEPSRNRNVREYHAEPKTRMQVKQGWQVSVEDVQNLYTNLQFLLFHILF